jgi:hypothetical protein
MAFGYVAVHQKARVPFCPKVTKVDVDGSLFTIMVSYEDMEQLGRYEMS